MSIKIGELYETNFPCPVCERERKDKDKPCGHGTEDLLAEIIMLTEALLIQINEWEWDRLSYEIQIERLKDQLQGITSVLNFERKKHSQ